LNNNVGKPKIIQKDEVEKKDMVLEKNGKPEIILNNEVEKRM
jgi:hypothetical protein